MADRKQELLRMLKGKTVKGYNFRSSIYIEPELEKEEKHKVDDAVTVDKKRDNKNDIQRSEEEDNKQLQSTTNTLF